MVKPSDIPNKKPKGKKKRGEIDRNIIDRPLKGNPELFSLKNKLEKEVRQ